MTSEWVEQLLGVFVNEGSVKTLLRIKRLIVLRGVLRLLMLDAHLNMKKKEEHNY